MNRPNLLSPLPLTLPLPLLLTLTLTLASCVDFDILARCHGGACESTDAQAPVDGGAGASTDAGQPTDAAAMRAGPGIKPNATNTGVPPGVALTVIDGDVTVTEDGTILDAQDIHGFLTIQASRVKVTRCVVRGRTATGKVAAIRVVSGTDVVVEDTEIAIAMPREGVEALVARAVTARRLNIHGAGEGVVLSGASAVEYSYIHDLLPVVSGVNKAIAVSSGTGIRIVGNNLVVTREQGAALNVSQDLPIQGLRVESNWADGGGCTFNFSHRSQGPLTVTVQGNRFGGNTLFADCPILKSTQTTLIGTGNVWDDTGEPIPVQSHD